MSVWRFGATIVALAVAVPAATQAQSNVGTSAGRLTNSIGMEMILVPAGSFEMGADPNFEDASASETPRHSVTIGKPFYLGKTEVTQEQWVAVMGSNPSQFKSRTNPVERVTWDDVQVFIRKLNEKEGRSTYRLPTEAEWEYACRAGTTSKYWFGDDEDALGRHAWFSGNSGEKTHPVATAPANAWGFHDMHGNVWEWVSDWYGEKYYASSPSTDPRGPAAGSIRVTRGGSWSFGAADARAARRIAWPPRYRGSALGLGFRLARSAP